MSINNVLISGNLTAEPELRQTQTGLHVLKFSVAVNERRKNQQNGEWENYPNYVECTMFGSRAEKLQQWLCKGLKVCVSGRLHYDKWMKDDEVRSKLSVIVDNIEFMMRKEKQKSAQPQAAQQPAQQSNYADEDIAF